MFTGIIEEIGRIRTIHKKGRVTVVEIAVSKVADDVKVGDSIAVDGACLTVTRRWPGRLAFEMMPETLRATTLKALRPGQEVNLERALKVGDRVGGHFVTGHVDAVGMIRSKRVFRGNLEFRVAVPSACLKFIKVKGSISVDGISLTVVDARGGGFSVYVLPQTLRTTVLKGKAAGSRVNVEVDMLMKRGPAA